MENTLSERRNQWRAPARLWASFFFFYGICSNGNEGIALTEHTREAECFRDVSYDMMLLADMTSRAVDYHDYLQRMWAL
ncbi:hypothetical protein PAALTS15_15696 [Paenibacillus alvei TS-15]|jgi:hypothetical protein|uniref:Uncharacterized protein n=1 Tax=Paenibacillus alvei TS-15 TaxID=1117108 RepID=S9SK74_PAEAL|nr:hypothetical protein PAALTS15_15696 [Paenibacillus alvei TS-15]